MGNANRPPRKSSVASQHEAGDLGVWAKALVASVGKRGARAILADYVARSKDSKVTKYGRAVAAQQAAALRKAL